MLRDKILNFFTNKMIAIDRPEAVYSIDDCASHFFIDCRCGGKSSHYKKNEDKTLEGYEYDFSNKAKREHTYFINLRVFSVTLENHRESEGHSPLIVVCDNCQREFPLTYEDFQELGREFNKQIEALFGET